MTTKKYCQLKKINIRTLEAGPVFILKPDFRRGPWICGGAPRQWVNDEPCTSDYDVYFRTERQYKKYKKIFDANDEYSLAFESENAETFRFGLMHKEHYASEKLFKFNVDVQFITKTFFDNVDQVLDSFDFHQAQLASDGRTVYGNPDALSNVLSFAFISPETFVKRWVKYTAYGYKTEPGALKAIDEEYNLTFDFTVNKDYD